MNFDLTIKAPKKLNKKKKLQRPLDPRLPFSGPVCACFVGLPKSGKTTCLLNVLGSSQFTRGLYPKIVFIGASLKNDPTMKPLIEYYGEQNAYDTYNDDLMKSIIQNQLMIPIEERDPLCIVIDDALSLGKSFERSTFLGQLGGSHRHWLKGSDGQKGCLVISTQKMFGYGGLTTALRSCLNVIIIFRVSGEQKLKLIETYGDNFGGKKQFEEMLNYCLGSEPFQSMNIYIDGSESTNGESCIYKSWTELIYPTSRFPKKSIFGENEEDN